MMIDVVIPWLMMMTSEMTVINIISNVCEYIDIQRGIDPVVSRWQ